MVGNAAALILGAGFLLDAALGDPVYPFHPVRLIGKAAQGIESMCFKSGRSGFGGGGLLFAGTVGAALLGYVGLRLLLVSAIPKSVFFFDLFVFYSCFALTDLLRHVRPVRVALEDGDPESAKAALKRIVGRDVRRLDRAGVARAAVECVAESFVDSLLSPLFWFVVFAEIGAALGKAPAAWGVAAAVVYRTVNTLDSMVGYKSERYRKFGFVSAKADDVLNYLPARLSVLPLFVAALLTGLAAAKGLAAWRQDRRKSPSPNAGHTESFVAGALGLRLGGPTDYPHGTTHKPWLGFGTPSATGTHVRASCRLIALSGWISAMTLVAILLG